MSVTTVPLLEDLQGPWADFAVELVGPGVEAEAAPEPVRDVYPFISVTDLKRLIWIQREGDPRWAPERVFLGVRAASGAIRPIEFHWPTSVTGGGVDLPDPIPAEARVPSPSLVDAAGNRKPVGPTMIGSLILETALSPEILATGGTIPRVVAISLAALTPAEPEAVTTALFGGFYQLYFPWLTAPAQVIDAAATVLTPISRDAYAAAIPYMEDRIGRIGIVQNCLRKRAGGASVSMTTMVRLRWTLPPPAAKPESLERTFYGLRASATLPFLRYFPAGGAAPLLKLGLKPDGSPILDNEKVFAQYLNQPAPVVKSAVILARIPLESAHVEAGAAFTLYMFDDGTCDITLEVPQRGATYIAAVAADAQRLLRDVVVAIGFPPATAPTLRDLHATYKWIHPDPRRAAPLSARRLQSRVASLTPFLDRVPPIAGETALAVFQWRAVSNYESESAQFAFITQLALHTEGAGVADEDGPAAMIARFVNAVSERFGISKDAAAATIERWMERRADAVAPAAGPGAGALAVPKHSTGSSISISGTHPEYTLEIQGVDSLGELQQIVSVVGVLLGASSADLTLTPPVPAVAAVAAAVAIEDAAVQEAAVAEGGPPPAEEVDLGEMDPAMAALMADLGFGGGDEMGFGGEEEAEAAEAGAAAGAEAGAEAGPQLVVAEEAAAVAAAAAAAPPDLDAAVAAVEEECRGTPWTAGEAALKLPADYYMTRLKRSDAIMFGFRSSATGRIKTYSKSCQRGDDRQPNSMTLAEYARIQNCYEGRVRFVNLPPRKASDLPRDPTYNPRRTYAEEYFFTDPESGLPMWTVYGYENKTRPGEYLYLMCAELWCERDNLPVLRSEFEGTQGRGFAKSAMSCPFCGGKAIADMAAPKSGESVIVRMPKESSGKVQRFIGTITRTKHPNGYLLPCCDTTPRLLEKYLEANYLGKLVFGRELVEGEGAEAEAAAAGGAGDDVAEPAPELGLVAAEEGPSIDYMRLLGSMQTQYILGNDKALEAGKIGLLPPQLDRFFGQVGPRALESRGIRPTFVEGAIVFVRIGVDTRLQTPGLNLFAGLAPLLNFRSAEETKTHILTRRMVRAFESANYGSLVTEFAARSSLSEDELTKSLPDFAGEYGYNLAANRAHVVRLYKAWTAFLVYLSDIKGPKRLRHIEHLLAQPGVIMPSGLLLVTLEQTGDKIEVVCPSFGIPPASIFGNVPVAFMWHDKRDESWEPIVLYNGTSTAVRFFGERTAELELVPRALRSSLQQWLRDWRSSSLGCGRPAPPPHVWTPDRDTSGLPRLSQLRTRFEGYSPSAMVRDRSNRLAGVLFSPAAAAAAGGGGGAPLFVPCLDDGALAVELPRVFEAEAIPAAPVDAYIRFYTALPFPALAPTKLLAKMDDATQIVGFMTTAGSMVPTASTPLGTAGLPALPVQQLDAFAWERDSLILHAPNTATIGATARAEATASVEEQMAEAYQHLRLSLSRWLIRDARGPTLRKDMGTILKGGLPLYEKRKRMDILLEPLVREWVQPSVTDARRAMSLLREDCLALPEAECSAAGACRWVAEGDRCMIHAPARTAGTDPVRIFTARLSDEVLRYAGKRRELMEDSVQSIRTPRGSVRVGDELYLAVKPKESTASVLERLGFTGQIAISFPEEMLRFEGMEEEAGGEEPAAAAEAAAVLPASWIEKGLQLPTPPEGLDDARRLAFAAGTNRSLEKWEDALHDRRKKLGVEGPVDRPFQWSTQDFYVIAALTLSNVLFVRQAASGKLVIDRWIQPPAGGAAAAGGPRLSQQMFMILWGPRELLLSRGKTYRFETKDLPADLLTALDGASPLAEEEARGYVEGGAAAVVAAAAEEESSSEPMPALEALGEPPPAAAPALDGNVGQLAPPAAAPLLQAAAVEEAPKLVVEEVAEEAVGAAAGVGNID
jgi:hypothetical protein